MHSVSCASRLFLIRTICLKNAQCFLFYRCCTLNNARRFDFANANPSLPVSMQVYSVVYYLRDMFNLRNLKPNSPKPPMFFEKTRIQRLLCAYNCFRPNFILPVEIRIGISNHQQLYGRPEKACE